MTPLALCLAMLTATPEYAVAVTRRLGIDPQRARMLATQLGQAIAAEQPQLGKLVAPQDFVDRAQKAGSRDPSTCSGDLSCGIGIGRAAGTTSLIVVQLMAIGVEVTIDAELLDVQGGRSLGHVTATLHTPTSLKLLAPLARQLLESLGPPKAPAAELGSELKKPQLAVDAPVEKAPGPPVPPVAVARIEPEGLTGRRKVAIGLGAGAVAAVGTGVVFGVMALNNANALKVNDPVEKKDAVRTQALVADVSYGVGIALAVGAGIAWLTGARAESQVRVIPTGREVLVQVDW